METKEGKSHASSLPLRDIDPETVQHELEILAQEVKRRIEEIEEAQKITPELLDSVITI